MSYFSVVNEQFPRLGQQIQDAWGSEKARSMLLDLINDSRDGARQGFSFTVASAIVGLLESHDKQFPQFDKTHATEIPFRTMPRQTVTPSSPAPYATLVKLAGFVATLMVVLGFIHSLHKHGLL